MLLTARLPGLPSLFPMMLKEGTPILASHTLGLLSLPIRRSPPDRVLTKPAASLALSLYS